MNSSIGSDDKNSPRQGSRTDSTIFEGFHVETHTFAGQDRLAYWSPVTGPGVIVCHEMPGITPEVIAFARRLVAAGFTVVMPHLIGDPGRPMTLGYTVRSMSKLCISNEFSLLAKHASSPATEWLRELGRVLHHRAGGPGIGAIGMCFSGNFALSLLLDAHLLAPVLSQPSMPIALTAAHARALHAPPAAIEAAKSRACPVLALRFTNDRLVPAARFETLRRELGDLAELIEIDSSKGNPHGIKRTAHSVLTFDLVDEVGHPTRAALDRVMRFLDERLRPASDAPAA